MSELIGPAEAIAPQTKSGNTRRSQAWYRPTVSPEHGVYVVLFISFLTGAAAAQRWTWATSLGLISAFFGFQAEHPLTLQLKQRRQWKPRFLIWGGLYAGISLAIAVYLYQHLAGWRISPLLWIYLGAIVAFLIDAISVFWRGRKSILNELITFAAICLSAPFAYIATTGTLSTTAIGLWILNTLFFSSAIFTVKLRKPDHGWLKQAPITIGVAYHAIAIIILFGLWYWGWLPPITAAAFSVALLKFGLVLWRQDWYRTTSIQSVATLETTSALLFLTIVAFSVLPAHLSMPAL
jgi:hypothetical protein